jgi:hypothetical protein
MILELENLQKYGVPVDHLDYRGVQLNFYEDLSGHQILAIWKDTIYEFGVYNTMYKDDAKLLIDEKLDTITRFENDPFSFGAKLEYFENAGYRDIKLSYRGRTIKVYLNPTDSDVDRILQDSRLILPRVIALWQNK